MTANPTGLLREGDTVTFNCTAPRVKPPPREIYLKFTDSDHKIIGRNMKSKNSDGLTSHVTLEYAITVNENMNGRKLKCYYVTQDEKIVTISEEATLKVLCEFKIYSIKL